MALIDKEISRYDWVNLFMPIAAKTIWLFWQYLSNESNFLNIFEEEMFISNWQTFVLQIFFQ